MVLPRVYYHTKKTVSEAFDFGLLIFHLFAGQMDLAAMFPSPPLVIQARIRQLSKEGYWLLFSQLNQPNQSEIDYKVCTTIELEVPLHRLNIKCTFSFVDSLFSLLVKGYKSGYQLY